MIRIRLIALLAVLLLVQVEVNAEEPAAKVKHAVLISIDGLRPDLLARAEVPRIRHLLGESSYSLWATTVSDPFVYTLPSHVSMLTGVSPDVHEVTWNDVIEESYSKVPTLFELAKSASRTTAMVTGKMKFTALNKPGSIDWVYLPPDEPVDDVEFVAGKAVEIMSKHRPHFLFVHLPGVDSAGHQYGWGSAQQLEALARADRAVGMLSDTLERLRLTDQTLLILTADHGGAGLTHGGNDPRSRTIPWIARGPGFRRGFDLTRLPELEINTVDTFATLCDALGLKVPKGIQAKVVRSPFDGQELLSPPATTTAPSHAP